MTDRIVTTAPARIWLQVSDNADDRDEAFPTDHEGITWCDDSVLDCQVPYVRADIVEERVRERDEARALLRELREVLGHEMSITETEGIDALLKDKP